MDNAMISFKNVSKIFCRDFDQARSYGFSDIMRGGRRPVPRPLEFFALQNVSLQLAVGESLVVFGTEQSGKTTMARLLCGLFRPDIGQVEVAGRVQCPASGKLGLNPYMTLREYLELLAAVLGVPVNRQRAYLTAVVDHCEIGSLIDTRMANFPRASLRPLTMAASLLADGDIFVFDGSYAAGSGTARVRCLEQVGEIVSTRTTVFFTGTPKLPPFPVDHAMILHEGRALYYGEPTAMLQVFDTLVADLKQARTDAEGSTGDDPRPPSTAVSVTQHLSTKNRAARSAMTPFLADSEAHRLGSSRGPILVGPWMGNSHSELLYWRPYVSWLLEQFDRSQRCIVAVSRAGADLWYRDLGSQYVDLLDLYSLEEFERLSAERLRATGMRKQRSISDVEQDILKSVARSLNLNLDECEVVHPGAMFRMVDEVWRRRLPADFVLRYSRFVKLQAAPPVDMDLPPRYVAARFNVETTYGGRAAAHDYVNEFVRALAAHLPVVTLDSGYSVEGEEFVLEPCDGLISMQGVVSARRSLELQTRVVAGATACVGTLGGTLPLALSLGVPTTCLYLEQPGFFAVHRTISDLMSTAVGATALDYVDMANEPATELAVRLLRADRRTGGRSRTSTHAGLAANG
jgi:ABC-type polysaccharide/polyol phosphate transport system ATPase subunit